MDNTTPDFYVQNEGSIVLLFPNTSDAHAWIDARVDDTAQWFGRAVIVEPRYIADIVAGAQADGFTVR